MFLFLSVIDQGSDCAVARDSKRSVTASQKTHDYCKCFLNFILLTLNI